MAIAAKLVKDDVKSICDRLVKSIDATSGDAKTSTREVRGEPEEVCPASEGSAPASMAMRPTRVMPMPLTPSDTGLARKLHAEDAVASEKRDADQAQQQALQHEKLAERLHGVCLLYTSPSPRDRTRSRMPSSA